MSFIKKWFNWFAAWFAGDDVEEKPLLPSRYTPSSCSDVTIQLKFGDHHVIEHLQTAPVRSAEYFGKSPVTQFISQLYTEEKKDYEPDELGEATCRNGTGMCTPILSRQ
jgi:hypothetical protein